MFGLDGEADMQSDHWDVPITPAQRDGSRRVEVDGDDVRSAILADVGESPAETRQTDRMWRYAELIELPKSLKTGFRRRVMRASPFICGSPTMAWIRRGGTKIFLSLLAVVPSSA